jgi:hypothetical protein
MPFLLLAAQPAWAADAELPLQLRLAADAGEPGLFRYATERYDGSTPLTTGFELSFTGTIPASDRVAVTFVLTLTLPGKGSTALQELEVNATFEAEDGEPVVIPATADGPEVIATAWIATSAGGAQVVLLEVFVPVGGPAFSLGEQKVLKEISLTGAHGVANSIRDAVEHRFVTGVSNGEAILTTLATASALSATTAAGSGSDIVLDVDVHCDLVDDSVKTRPVRIDGLQQKLQLPVQRSIQVVTHVTAGAGASLAVAGVQSAAGPSELVIIVTPTVVVEAPAPQVLLNARVALLSGGGLMQVEGAMDRTQVLKEISGRATEPNTGRAGREARRTFVVGYQDNEPVTMAIETGTVLIFTPTSIGLDANQLDVQFSTRELFGEAGRFPFATPSGQKWIDLPETRSVELTTRVAAADGQTMALGGRLFERLVAGRSDDAETLVVATSNPAAGGGVRLDARLAQIFRTTVGSKKNRTDTEHSLEERVDCTELEPGP